MCEIPSLLSLCRVAVVGLIKNGHQLEQDDLPASLIRYLTFCSCDSCHDNDIRRYVEFQDVGKKWSIMTDDNFIIS